MAQNNDAAIVHAAGMVSINGGSVRNLSLLRAGDVLQSGADSTAVISRKGLMIIISPNSTLRYSARGLELKAGTVKIATSSGLIAKVDPFEITPNGEMVKFRLSNNGSCAAVSPERGTVVVRDGNTTRLVPTGATSVFGQPSCAPSEDSQPAKMSAHAASYKTVYALAGAATVSITYGLKKAGKISPDSPDE